MSATKTDHQGWVLIVDDNTTERLILARYMEELGLNSVPVANGQEALNLLQERTFDLMLLDLSMPVVPGLQVLRSLQSGQRLTDMPVIVISGSFDDQAAECIGAGADDYLHKPFDPTLLKARIGSSLDKKRLRQAQEAHLREMEQVRDQLARSNEELKEANLNLEALAYSDELTGLANRRAGLLNLSQLWALSERGDRPLSCILIDLDHFKQINDGHGHDCGDFVLRQASKQLQTLVRAADMVCRFGGEEFLVICPDTPLAGAQVVAERMRQGLQLAPVTFRDYLGPVTASLGVAERGPGVPHQDELINAADRALYQAKGEGRNRVVCFVPGRSSPTSAPSSEDSSTRLNDAARLRALEETRLLDAPADERIQKLVRLASQLLDVPVSMTSLVTNERQFFAAAQGLGEPLCSERQTPLSHSFCKIVVETASPLQVDDAPKDARVCDNPAIRDNNVLAYLGFPLRTSQGQILGALCAIDNQPRMWKERDSEVLQILASSVSAELELRIAATLQARLAEAYREARLGTAS